MVEVQTAPDCARGVPACLVQSLGQEATRRAREEELGLKASPHLSVGGIAHARDEVLCHPESCLPLLLVSFSPWINRKGFFFFSFLRVGTLSSPHSIFFFF